MKIESDNRACVIWLTGLPASGKTTLAEALGSALSERGIRFEHLDGDQIRSLFPKTGFSREERNEHIQRVGWAASLLEKHGVIAIVSLVSPYRESRDWVRAHCRRFIEVHVATPLAECERRDPKGLYKKARHGEIKSFTGIDDPYEVPLQPELTFDTTAMTVAMTIPELVSAILAKGKVGS